MVGEFLPIYPRRRRRLDLRNGFWASGLGPASVHFSIETETRCSGMQGSASYAHISLQVLNQAGAEFDVDENSNLELLADDDVVKDMAETLFATAETQIGIPSQGVLPILPLRLPLTGKTAQERVRRSKGC